MSKFLIHVHTGPENPTKAALGLAVAAAAARQGHEVDAFLAGDAVHLFGPQGDVEGLGTGSVKAHLAAIAEAGGRFHLSGMSSKARGYDESLLEGRPAVFALPDDLVRLADAADTVLCY